jgi:hypothetical protein
MISMARLPSNQALIRMPLPEIHSEAPLVALAVLITLVKLLVEALLKATCSPSSLVVHSADVLVPLRGSARAPRVLT